MTGQREQLETGMKSTPLQEQAGRNIHQKPLQGTFPAGTGAFWLPLKHRSPISQEAQSKGTAQAPQRTSGLRDGETRQKQEASELAGINYCGQVSGPLGSVSSVQQPRTRAGPGQRGWRLEQCVCSSRRCLRPWGPRTRTSLPGLLLGGQAGVIQRILFAIFYSCSV